MTMEKIDSKHKLAIGLSMIGFASMAIGFLLTAQEMTSLGPTVMLIGFCIGAVGIGIGFWFLVFGKNKETKS